MLYIILGANLFVFLMWLFSGNSSAKGWMNRHFVASWHNVRSGRFWTFLSSSFSQKTFNHFLFNMLTLYFLGSRVCHVIGGARFLHLYLVGGVASSITSLLINGPYSSVVGASGSVMAIAVLYAALFPKQILYLYFVVPVPAVALVGLFVLVDVFGLTQPHSSTSHVGHLAGAGVGAAYFYYNLKKGRIVKF
eukprot:TRINITY_DN4910_c0_g1_i10.p1 TRINITY_DN4910_c0_g1~~TRINITY_DN4910_c0_g1_i10.p1  ORF type:complete len:192 (-),score=28.97 TRINITY_DN4910_c0_g1_i10:281-856(-)